MPIARISNGIEFELGSNLSILESAARANIILPYSCKTGQCSACRCKVKTGKTFAIHPETGLTEQEKKEGWILSCVRIADTDLSLEIDDIFGFDLPPVKTLPCRISCIESLARDVIQVKLRLPPAVEFNFIPGQYVDVIGPNGIRRSYSLANASFSDKVLELHIRAVEGGVMSHYWFRQSKQNDLLRLNGPLGTFFLRETGAIDLIFLATGTGIAPIKSMIESLAQYQTDYLPKSITVLWGGRHAQDLYLKMDDIPVKFTYIPVLSSPADGWAGAEGYVQEVLLHSKPDLGNSAVYACGSNVMIQSAKARLLEAGLPAKRFYSDAFVSSGTI